DLRTLSIEEVHATKYFVRPGVSKMYYDLRNMNWWLSMRKDIAGGVTWKGVVPFGKKGELAPRHESEKTAWPIVIADIFTKGLPRVLFDDFRDRLSDRPPPAATIRSGLKKLFEFDVVKQEENIPPTLEVDILRHAYRGDWRREARKKQVRLTRHVLVTRPYVGIRSFDGNASTSPQAKDSADLTDLDIVHIAPLTSLVKPRGGIRAITLGTVWRCLVSKVSDTRIGHSLDGYLNDLQLGVGVSRGGEAILHAVNQLIEDRSDDVGLSMLLVDFKNAFNLVDREVMLQEVRTRCPAISRWVEFFYTNPARLYYGKHTLTSCQGVQQGDPLGPLLFAIVLHPLVRKIKDSFNLSPQAWYLDDGTIIGDTLVVREVLKVIIEDGPRRGMHLYLDKTKVFSQRRTREAGLWVFSRMILPDPCMVLNY
nr:hypothetical protein [Tanacetum cinerariifolium]